MTLLNVIVDVWHCLEGDCIIRRQMSLQLKLLEGEWKRSTGPAFTLALLEGKG